MGTNRKPPKKGGFFWERQLYQSPAFLNLHKNAMTMLIALMDVRRRESQSQARDKKGSRRKPEFIDLDRLEMPYVTLQKKYNMKQAGIVLAINSLLAHGFIDITHYGGRGKHNKTRYALIEDYLKWKPGTVFRTRVKDINIGYQGQKLGAIKKWENRGTEKIITHDFDTLTTHDLMC